MIRKTGKILPYLKSLTRCLAKLRSDGYSDDMQIENGVLKSLQTEKFFYPHELVVVNYFRFEGMSDLDDNAILYIIETNDGTKGTLVDAFGVYSNPDIAKFMKAADDINKESTKTPL